MNTRNISVIQCKVLRYSVFISLLVHKYSFTYELLMTSQAVNIIELVPNLRANNLIKIIASRMIVH